MGNETSVNLKDQNIITDKNSGGVKLNYINDIGIGGQQNNSNNFYNKNIIIAVISNKGGVGKTSIAIAFAMFLSQKIKKRILLLELDSSPGDFGVIFDIEREKSLELALRFPENYDKFVKNVYRNVDALKGISNPLVAENISKGTINRLIDYILKDYSCIIVDTQTVINGLVLDVLKFSNKIFAVSEYSLESIARISSLIDILVKKFSIPEYKIKLIVNKKNFLSFFKVWDISKIINIPIDAFITFDYKFNKSKFLFDKASIFNTKFFKEISKMLLKIDMGVSNNVERQTL